MAQGAQQRCAGAEPPRLSHLPEIYRKLFRYAELKGLSAQSARLTLLLDTGPAPIPLHVVSPFMDAGARATTEKAVAACRDDAWVSRMGQPMPPLKDVAGSR